MSESNQKEGESKRRFSQEQYEILLRCSEKNDPREWNEWRQGHPNAEIFLEGADLTCANLTHANLNSAHLKEAKLSGAKLIHTKLIGVYMEQANCRDACIERGILEAAHLYKTNFMNANLKGAVLTAAHLAGAILNKAHLEGANLEKADLTKADLLEAHIEGASFKYADLGHANFRRVTVNGATIVWKCNVDRHLKNTLDRSEWGTDFSGVGLASIRIDPGTKQLLEYNIRRMNWQDYYQKYPTYRWPFQFFWLMSNYGISTRRIIITFFGLAIAFAFLYWLSPELIMVQGVAGELRGFWHGLYFSVVTMTTLGFGDIAANPDSWWGQTLLMVQVILGYVLLGALVTRFAVLFMAGGPAGEFADEKRKNTHPQSMNHN